jgi:AraC-like DNA-binding protein
MTTTAYMPTSFVAVLLRYLDTRSLRVPELRAELKLLAEQPKMDSRRYARLLTELERVEPLPALGLQVGRMIEPQDFGLVGYLLTACSTLGQALTRYGRYQTLVLTELSTQVEVTSTVVSHRWHLPEHVPPVVCEFRVAIFISLYQALIGKTIAPVKVGLPFAVSADRHLYEALLGCPVEFGAACLTIDVPAHLMWMTISSSDPYLRKIFDRQATVMLQAEERNHDRGSEHTDERGVSVVEAEFLAALQQQLLMAMKDGDTQASRVARLMGYSLRSFYRKLAEQGYSYRGVLAGLRRRLAKKYLADPALSYADIAMLLGYSEQSAFIRAFKDWMGVTPGEYRKGVVK